MKGSSIVRRIDKLGRITIPKELCKKLEIVRGQTNLEFYTQGGTIILTHEEKPACVFCKSEKDIVEHNSKHICRKCMHSIYSKNEEN